MIEVIRRSIDKVLVRIVVALLSLTFRSKRCAVTDNIEIFLRAMAPTLGRISALSDKRSARLRDLLRSLLLDTLPEDARSTVPSLMRRETPVCNTWVFQNEVMKWDIPADAQVLDVGSGGWPFKLATALADKYVGSTTHRVESISRDNRPFYEVDLENLPFEDKSWNFIFCSHVLEHMDNPGKAMRELMRVGECGYIEMPTRLSDVMFNFTRISNHHRWHTLVLGTTLVMIEWPDHERRELGNEFFEALQSSHSNAFQDFFERNRDLFFTSLHWKESFDFLVIDKHGKVIDTTLGEKRYHGIQ